MQTLDGRLPLTQTLNLNSYAYLELAPHSLRIFAISSRLAGQAARLKLIRQVPLYANLVRQVSPYANLERRVSPCANLGRQATPYANLAAGFWALFYVSFFAL